MKKLIDFLGEINVGKPLIIIPRMQMNNRTMAERRGLLLCVSFSMALFVFALSSAANAAPPKSQMAEFKSESGFSIRYPRSWQAYTDSRQNLDIISGNKRLEGVIIPHGEAMIAVFEAPPVEGNYATLFSQQQRDEMLSYKVIKIGRPVSGGCGRVYWIKSRSEIGPHAYQVEQHFYCPIGGRLFILSLTRWQGDRTAPNGYNLAIEMLKSLRLR